MIMSVRFLRSILFLALVSVVCSFPSPVLAGEFTIRPFLIDKTVVPRDVVTETIKLTNDATHRKYVIFATVNEITVDTEGLIKEFVTPVMTDRTVTPTSWVEVKRGRIEIPPGEEREVPLTLRIHPDAEPGEYHLFVGFVPARNRPIAEDIAMAGEADGVVMKITVADQRQETMRISRFLIDRFITTDDKRQIDVEIQNLGDISSAPMGEIIFYDNRGVEVMAVPFNESAEAIAPGEKKVLSGTVPLEADLGRYKANLALQYGEKQRAALYDTTSFYMIPLPILIGILLTIIIISTLIAVLFRRAFAQSGFHDEPDEVTMFVRDGHDGTPQDHDIDLKKTE